MVAAPTPPPMQAAAPAPPVKDTRYITIDFDNVDIQVFIRFISEMTGKNFVFDDKVKGKITILSPRKITVDEAYKVFQSVLDVNGFAAIPAGDVVKIIPMQQAKEKQVETRVDGGKISPEDRMVTQIISLDHANADEMKKVLDPLVPKTSVVIPYAQTGMLIITDLLSNIKRLEEIVTALDTAGVGEQISYIPLKYAAAADVIKALTAVFQQQKGGIAPIRFFADERANAVIIMSSEIDAQRIKELIAFMDKEVTRSSSMLHVYKLQNAVAEDLAKVLMNLPRGGTAGAAAGPAGTAAAGAPVLSRNVQIVADKATNALGITAPPADYHFLESVIKRLDTPRPMVYIECLIMEVGLTKDFRLGVQWQLVKDTGAISNMQGLSDPTPRAVGVTGMTAPLGSSIFPTVAGTAVGGLPPGFSVGIMGAGIQIGGVTFPTIGAMLQAMSADSDISILATPQLLTLDHEDAEINVGENIPYITRQDQTNVGVTGTNYSNYDYKDVGVILKITPHISEENHIRLKIDQQLTKVKGTQSTTPTTLKRAAKTTVVVKDKETVVIGGLIDDQTDVSTIKIPLLGDIPILGWLFKYQTKLNKKGNLFTFITPHIIRTQTDASALTKVKMDMIGTQEEGVIRMYDPKKDKTKTTAK
jgi:general secretion pathway protein D